MNDDEFFSLLYQTWSRTTGSENPYWMYEELESSGFDTVYEVYAVDQEQEQHFVASFSANEDADFITAVHGCLPDLIRKLQEALDEADRLDTERDEMVGRVAELELEVDSLNARLVSYAERIKEEESFSEGLDKRQPEPRALARQRRP